MRWLASKSKGGCREGVLIVSFFHRTGPGPWLILAIIQHANIFFILAKVFGIRAKVQPFLWAFNFVSLAGYAHVSPLNPSVGRELSQS
jgi:hypothetical protein